jgi:hypothetical protein
LDWTTAYLPAFVVGVLFPVGDLLKKVPSTWTARVLGMVVLVSFLFVTDGGSWPEWRDWHWWQTHPVKDAHMTWVYQQAVNQSCTHNLSVSLFWAEFFFKMMVLIAFVLFVLVTVCPRDSHWFTYAGGEGAFYAYMLHWFVIVFYDILLAMLGLPVVENPYLCLLVWLFQFAVSLCLVLALASKRCIWLTSWLLKPTWLVNLLLGVPAASGAEGTSKTNDTN